MRSLEFLPLDTWEKEIDAAIQQKAIKSLENGKVIFLPNLPFELSSEEQLFLTPTIADPKSKNVSYDIRSRKMGGVAKDFSQASLLQEMLHRYAIYSKRLMDHLFPHYTRYLIQARTSFRPAEIEGRKSSYRKDDTRLHVDAFPSSPAKGERILRVFTNVNLEGKPRVWRLGEPFQDVLQKMSSKFSKPIPASAFFLKLFNITKDYRSLYDHYMLQMHDGMKGDMTYQKNAPQEEVHFNPGCTWITFTDQVSHAAMKGQHVLEQTFHLPVYGLLDEQTSPLRTMERFFKKSLV